MAYHFFVYLFILFSVCIAFVDDDQLFNVEFSFGTSALKDSNDRKFIASAVDIKDNSNSTFNCQLPTILPNLNTTELVSVHPTDLLKPLQNMTLNLISSGYFHYQLRPGRMAIQFHSDLSQKDVPIKDVQAYLLGSNDIIDTSLEPAVLLASDSLDVVPISGEIHSPDGSEPYFVEHFEGGTKCASVVRSAEVRYMCGSTPKDALAVLESVVEDRTCHYVLNVRTPLMCTHVKFAKVRPVGKISCQTSDLSSIFGAGSRVSIQGGSIKLGDGKTLVQQ
ncbi:hypothetical protein RCL1_003374 [Eukaryota sp. TZLM3-RCL]